MKTKVILDLWGMIISWCLYLNGHTAAAFAVAVVMTVMMLLSEGEVSFRRVAAVSLAFYAVQFSLYLTSSIPFFFPGLHVFLAVQILNASLVNEHLSRLDHDLVPAVLSVTALAMAFICGLILLVDDADYSLFTKKNLFLMVSFIFLPYFLPCAYRFVYQVIRPVDHRKGALD